MSQIVWNGKVFRAVSRGLEMHEYAFDGPPYLGYPASFDVHGDGLVVVALAGGHTLGCVVVFVTLPDAARCAFIGDLTWPLDGIPLLPARFPHTTSAAETLS